MSHCLGTFRLQSAEAQTTSCMHDDKARQRVLSTGAAAETIALMGVKRTGGDDDDDDADAGAAAADANANADDVVDDAHDDGGGGAGVVVMMVVVVVLILDDDGDVDGYGDYEENRDTDLV